MQKTNVKALTESGVMTGIAVIAGLISIYIPLIGDLVSLVWPVPIILLIIRHGYKWAILTTLASGLIISILTDPVRAARVVLLFPIGIGIGHAFRAGYSPGKTMFWGSAAAVVSSGALTALTILLLGVNPFDLNADMMEKAFWQIADYQRSLGFGEEQLAQMRNLGFTFIRLFKVLIPVSFLFAAVFMAYMNFATARLVLKRLGHAIDSFPQFKLWMLPRYYLYLLLAGLGLSILGERQSLDWLYTLGINLLCFGAVFTFVQGLALIYFLADKYNLSRLARGIILLLIFSNTFFYLAVIYAGAFDMVLDCRRLRTKHPS